MSNLCILDCESPLLVPHEVMLVYQGLLGMERPRSSGALYRVIICV